MDQLVVRQSLIKLLSWCEQQDYAGKDPYDLVEKSKLLQRLAKPKQELSFFEKVQLVMLNWLINRFPLLLRRLFSVKEKIHPTAMAGFMVAYLNLYEKDKDVAYLKKAECCRKWLIDNRISSYSDYCWGTPFAWKSGGTDYPIGTPFAVVCVWVGQAFLKSYEVTESEEDLAVLNSIGRFLTDALHITPFEDDTICFSYSPKKPDLINNANLFVASFLAELYKLGPNDIIKDLALSAANYSIRQQLDNGLVPYFGIESDQYRVFNDSYHSSYEIRALMTIAALLDHQPSKEAALRYMDYCRVTYLGNGGMVTLSANKRHIVDGTSLAEFMILFSAFPQLDKGGELEGLLKYTLEEFQAEDGFFYYRKIKERTLKISYIRWIQGWMAWGLSSTLSYE